MITTNVKVEKIKIIIKKNDLPEIERYVEGLFIYMNPETLEEKISLACALNFWEILRNKNKDVKIELKLKVDIATALGLYDCLVYHAWDYDIQMDWEQEDLVMIKIRGLINQLHQLLSSPSLKNLRLCHQKQIH